MVETTVNEVVEGSERDDGQNNEAVVYERMVLFLLKVAETKGLANIQPGNNDTND